MEAYGNREEGDIQKTCNSNLAIITPSLQNHKMSSLLAIRQPYLNNVRKNFVNISASAKARATS
jgi:hypothetical protein